MADLTATHAITCSGCPRTFNMSLHTLKQKKTCTMCGAALKIPAEVLAQLDNLKATTVSLGSQKPVPGECPVCARTIFAKPESFGKRMKCQYCTAPMSVSSAGAVTLLRSDDIGIVEKGIIEQASCPECRQKKLAALPGRGLNARCESCNATVDIAAPELENYLDFARLGNALMTDFAHMALQARWALKDVTLTEANLILSGVNRLDAWAAATHRPLSPFSVEVTADLVQYVICCNHSAMSDRVKDGLMLIFPMRADGVGLSGQGLESAALGNAVGLGLLAATGTGFVMLPGRGGRKAEEKSGEPASCLLLLPVSNGSELMVLSRDASGNLGKPPTKFAQNSDAAVRGAMLLAAQQYFCFKAIFGEWADGAMLCGVTANALQRRLEFLGGTLADKAGDFSQALLPKPALNW